MPEPGYIPRLLLLGLIIAINGFFAAAEVALLSVRDSRLRHLAGEGNAGAQMALSLLARPEKLLSVTQVGVTLASLGLGWAGEDTLFSVFLALAHPVITPSTTAVLRAVCFVLAFLLMTYCHVVIGEVVPKNLAIDKADRLAVVVAPALMVFYRIAAPFISVIELSSAAITRLLGGKSAHGAGGGHSAEELKLIVSSSRFAGRLPETQESIIHRVLDLEDLSAREIMIPRRDIVSVAANASLDEVLSAMVESQHSRLPVWEGSPEHMIGAVYFKDMLQIWHDRRAAIRGGHQVAPFHVARVVRKPLIIPETKPLLQMLEEFRLNHLHMGLVVDEFGTVTGLLTVEDVLEQIVGEILDESDERLVTPRPEANEMEVDGSISIRDFDSLYGVELPADGGFETLAGYMLFRLGHIPVAGEAVEFEGRCFAVTAMERNRIARVHVTRLGDPAEAVSGNGAGGEMKGEQPGAGAR